MRWVILTTVLLTASAAFSQTPQPFPRPGERQPRPADPPVNTGSPAPSPASKTASPPAAVDPNAPAADVVWFPVYPAAQFLASYDAGRNQRYYIYGTTSPFADIVNYYKTQLDEKGNLVFREPPTHMFEVGRFRDETMAFPPGVTVKDWTWGGSQGYPNPRLRAQPAHYPTIIMIVPPPPSAQPSR